MNVINGKNDGLFVNKEMFKRKINTMESHRKSFNAFRISEIQCCIKKELLKTTFIEVHLIPLSYLLLGFSGLPCML
jgi:hypothetical protein